MGKKSVECIKVMFNVFLSQGINVRFIKKPFPTPLHALYAKENKDDINLSILLTASHNPWEYGGVNLVTKDGAIAGSNVTQDVANEIIDISEKGAYFIDTKNRGKESTIDEEAYQLYKTKIEESGLIDFEKIKIPKCRCRRFSPTARGRSVPCGAFLPSPGVLRRGRDIHEPTRSSCYENVGENTDDWRTPQDI